MPAMGLTMYTLFINSVSIYNLCFWKYKFSKRYNESMWKIKRTGNLIQSFEFASYKINTRMKTSELLFSEHKKMAMR